MTERERIYRDALRRIADAQSGVWGQRARAALDAVQSSSSQQRGTAMYEFQDLIVGIQDDMVVIATGAATIQLTEDQARWLQWAGLPSALLQLEQSSNVDNSDST